MKFIAPLFVTIFAVALAISPELNAEPPKTPPTESKPKAPEDAPKPPQVKKMDLFFSENTEGYEPISFRFIAIEFGDNGEPLLMVGGDGAQGAKYDIRVVPQEYKTKPDFWEIRVLGKPVDREDKIVDVPRVWMHRMKLKNYAPTINDPQAKEILEKIQKATGKKYVQPTKPIIGNKGVVVTGKNRSVKLTLEDKK